MGEGDTRKKSEERSNRYFENFRRYFNVLEISLNRITFLRTASTTTSDVSARVFT